MQRREQAAFVICNTPGVLISRSSARVRQSCYRSRIIRRREDMLSTMVACNKSSSETLVSRLNRVAACGIHKQAPLPADHLSVSNRSHQLDGCSPATVPAGLLVGQVPAESCLQRTGKLSHTKRVTRGQRQGNNVVDIEGLATQARTAIAGPSPRRMAWGSIYLRIKNLVMTQPVPLKGWLSMWVNNKASTADYTIINSKRCTCLSKTTDAKKSWFQQPALKQRQEGTSHLRNRACLAGDEVGIFNCYRRTN